MSHPRSVVVTGMGLVSPLGMTPAEHRLSRAGTSAICRIPPPHGLMGIEYIFGASLPEFSIAKRLKFPKMERFLRPHVQAAVLAAVLALESSGLELERIDSEMIGVFTASGQTGIEANVVFPALALAWEGRVPSFSYLGKRESRLVDRYFSLSTLSNGGVAMLSMELGALGQSSNHVQGDVAFACALRSACEDLRASRCEVAFVGGYDSLLTASTYLAYREAGFLASDGRCVPFDDSSSGLCLGEAAAFFVLEPRPNAERRGAKILGELVGVGTSQETTEDLNKAWTPETLQASLEQAQARVAETEFVVAHGIGIPRLDQVEIAALDDAGFGLVPRLALKGWTGYLGAATGALDLGVALLELAESTTSRSAVCISRSWSGQIAAITVQPS